LDGTLLNHDDYSFQEALPAIGLLKKLDIPLMPVSSKTLDEMLILQKELDYICPFVCENGALIVIPPGVLKDAGLVSLSVRMVGDHRCYHYGEGREDVLKKLQVLRPLYKFLGFSDMVMEDIARYTGLPPALAELANKRIASEPLVWLDTEDKLGEFSRELSNQNLKVVKGGRFYHVMGECDKGFAVGLLSELYRRHYGKPVYTIALGDSPNDLDMLKNVNLPIIVPRVDGTCLQDPALNKPVIAPFPGARGWNDAISQVMEELMNNNMEHVEG
jgi:mannosyl-3-phosphoglycerate phosphatase